MCLYIPNEHSKHGVSVLKVCGHRSLLRAYLVTVPQDHSQVRTSAGESLADLTDQYCPDISGSQHAKKQILEVYRTLLIFWRE